MSSPFSRLYDLDRSGILDGMRKNPHAVALGKIGGKRGGPARAAALSPERRKEIAKLAVQARWKKAKRQKAKD